jgi:hypothetical protein
MDMDDNDFDGVFQNATVDDFLRSTSAVGETPHTETEREVMKKRTAFSRFVEGMVVTCKTQAGINPKAFPAFAVLVGGNCRRYFRPDDDETAWQWAERLHREALAMNAEWVFVALCAPARIYNTGDVLAPIDPNDPTQLKEALSTGEISLGLCWFAERHDDTHRVRRGGVIGLSPHGSPTDVTEGDVDEDKNPFARVLDR